jgi:hypothetical protein
VSKVEKEYFEGWNAIRARELCPNLEFSILFSYSTTVS